MPGSRKLNSDDDNFLIDGFDVTSFHNNNNFLFITNVTNAHKL